MLWTLSQFSPWLVFGGVSGSFIDFVTGDMRFFCTRKTHLVIILFVCVTIVFLAPVCQCTSSYHHACPGGIALFSSLLWYLSLCSCCVLNVMLNVQMSIGDVNNIKNSAWLSLLQIQSRHNHFLTFINEVCHCLL